MARFFKSVLSSITTIALVTGMLALPACAQDEGLAPPPQAQPQAQKKAQTAEPDHALDQTGAMDKNIETRIKSLHSQLKITPQQENDWNAVSQVMRHNQKAMHDLIQQRRSNTKMTALENLESYQRISNEHSAGLQRLIPVFTTLYNSMSDQQKKTADSVFMRKQAERAAKAKKGKQ